MHVSSLVRSIDTVDLVLPEWLWARTLIILEHWDHVMTFPKVCEHAMTVVNTHLSQIKVYQNQVEERLAICDKESGLMMKQLGMKREARKIRHIKQKLFKKKLKSMVASMKCKHAR